MNMTTLTSKGFSARFFALLIVVSLVMTAFPVAFFSAYATTEASANAPTLDTVTPTTDTIELATGENLVLTVDANDVDGDLRNLEIDHSYYESLPEFSVYPSTDNPYGVANATQAEDFDGIDEGDSLAAAFAQNDITVTYDEGEQEWKIDFGTDITQTFVDGNGVTFYVALKDKAGNSWGSMYGSGSNGDPDSYGDWLGDKNTFKYDLSRAAASAPVEEVEEPSGRSGGSSSGTRVRDRVEPTPLVLGVSDSQELTAEELSAFLTSISAILAGIQSGSEAGDISDEEVTVLSAQLGKILTVLLGMFR